MRVLNLVRHPTTETGFSPVYQAQQRDYSERYSIHEQNAVRWRHIAFGCIGITFLAVGGLVYDASLSKYVPYVVERDHLGDEVAVGLSERAAAPDLRIIQSQIGNWIYNVRTVSIDAQTERHFVTEAYNHTNKSSPAKGELDEWFLNNNPFKRAVETIVTITITSTLPAPAGQWKSWHVNWREEIRTRTGDLESVKPREASITVSYRAPSTETEFKKNPTGVFVDNFDWKN
jgi:type IV secretion system protein VirB5